MSDALYHYTRDPFGGFLESFDPEQGLMPGSLLDVPAAHRWFEMLQVGLPESLYTYQLPLSKASGPDTRVLDSDIIMFSSYSYLGIIGHPRLAKAVKEAVDRYGTSTGGVRLLTGTLEIHLELEQALASFLRQEAAATFASGYDANVAAITSLFGPSDTAILDQFAHRSIHDGVSMAGCTNKRFKHNDMDDLERRIRQARNRGSRRILVAVDSVFSMDGDQAPLADLIEIKRRNDVFLLVDEAHSVGAIGATGRGICEEQNINPADIDVLTGSLGKSIPSSGGFVAGSMPLKIYLQHGSAPYIFSAAMTPANAAASLETLRIIHDEPEHLERLRKNTRTLADGLKRMEFDTGNSTTPILPLLLGDDWRAYRWARLLLEHGIFASAVTFPAVSPGLSRLRLCATSAHRPEHFERLFEGLAACKAEEETG